MSKYYDYKSDSDSDYGSEYEDDMDHLPIETSLNKMDSYDTDKMIDENKNTYRYIS